MILQARVTLEGAEVVGGLPLLCKTHDVLQRLTTLEKIGDLEGTARHLGNLLVKLTPLVLSFERHKLILAVGLPREGYVCLPVELVLAGAVLVGQINAIFGHSQLQSLKPRAN